MAKKAKTPKGKAQSELPIEGPGVSPISIPEVDKAAEKYNAIKNARCKISPKEIAAKADLLTAMHSHKEEIGTNAEGEMIYRYGDEVITVTPGKEKIKITTYDEPTE